MTIENFVKEKGTLVDTIIDFPGLNEQTVLTAQRVTGAAGLIVLVGFLTPQVPLLPGEHVTKSLTIQTSFSGEVDGLERAAGAAGQWKFSS